MATDICRLQTVERYSGKTAFCLQCLSASKCLLFGWLAGDLPNTRCVTTVLEILKHFIDVCKVLKIQISAEKNHQVIV